MKSGGVFSWKYKPLESVKVIIICIIQKQIQITSKQINNKKIT